MVELVEVFYFNKVTLFTGKISLTVTTEYDNCSISTDGIEFPNSPNVFKGADLFVALTLLRSYIEKQDIYLLCSGARIDVYPSGMTRDMSNGRMAYVTRIGKSTEQENLVEIFSPADSSEIGSVADQKAFHQRWIDSFES